MPKKPKRDRTLERATDKAILDTLKYRALFNACVSVHQLATLLLVDRKIPLDSLETRLKNLVRSKKIAFAGGKYHLPNIKPLSWDARANTSHELVQEIQTALTYLAKIKWLKLLAISGSVAAYNAKKEDDIDIFIITEKNRLWLTRFFVVTLLKALGKYRHDNDFAGKICPNIYIDDQNMVWPQKKRNIYTAHEILMMHPIINRDDTYFKFLKLNDWVFDYFPNYQVHLPEKVIKTKKYESSIVDTLDFLLMLLQLWYMKKKKTTEVTKRHLIHFNKHDYTEKVLSEFAAKS